MKNTLLFAGLVLLTAWPVGAAAQSQDDPDDAPQGRYLLGDAFSFTPALVVVAGRDSNAIRTNGGTAAGEVYVVPQVEGWLGRGKLRLNFADAFEVSSQQTATLSGTPGETKGQLNQYHIVRVGTVGPRLTLEGRASHRNHYAPPTDFVGFELGIKSRRIEQTFGADAAVTPGGRLQYKGRLETSRLRYDADARFQGASLEKNLNRNLTNFGGEVDLAITPMSSASISVTGFRDRFLFAPDRDGDGIYVMGGAAFSPRALIAGRAEAGYLGYKVVQTGTRYGGPAYNLGLSFSRSPIFIDVSGRRYIEYSFDPGQGFFVSNGIDAFSTLSAGSAWELFGRAVVRQLSPKGNLALDQPARRIDSFKTGLVRKFGRATKIGVDVEKYKTGGPGGFQGLRTTLFFIYGSTRLQRLDRPLPGGF